MERGVHPGREPDRRRRPQDRRVGLQLGRERHRQVPQDQRDQGTAIINRVYRI